MLREQLEQAGLANEALSQDIRRLTADWTKAREELEQKESDWRREEESFHNYFSTEHSRLLALWRQVEVKGRLQTAQSSIQQLRKQQGEAESGRREAELHLQAMQGERDDAQRERETAVRERDRLRQERDKLLSETECVQQSVQALQTKLQLLQMDCERLQQAADELVRLEQERLELDSTRLSLHQSLQESEQTRAGLEAELQVLRMDRQKLQNKVTQLCDEVSCLGAELGVIRGEGERRGVALEEAGRGRAELARERAGLVVQLTASERDNAALTEELAAHRVEKEALETSLFELQQQLMQSDLRREQLEKEIHEAQLSLRNALSDQQEELERLFNDKALSLKETEKVMLSEKVCSLQAELSSVHLELEKLSRETQHLKEQERTAVGAVNKELQELRLQLEDTVSSNRRELRRLQEKCTEEHIRADNTLRELEECRALLSASEENRDTMRRDLLDTEIRLSQLRDTGEGHRRDTVELRRFLCDVTKEKDALNQSNSQLREALRSAESERISVKRQCEEKEQRVAVLEETLASAQKEVGDLRSCLRERDASSQLQEARSSEKKLQDELRNLSLRAQSGVEASAQVQLQLSEAQGRLSATEAELTRSEAARRDLEFRLASLQSALTRTLGIGAGGRGLRGRSPAGSAHSSLISVVMPRRRSVSPTRTSLSPPKDVVDKSSKSSPDNTSISCPLSPERGDTPIPLMQPDLDPETLRSGLRDFLQELREAQRERTLRLRSAALCDAQRSLQTAQTERVCVEERVCVLQRAVALLETEKKDAERQAVRLEKDKNALRNTLEKEAELLRASQRELERLRANQREAERTLTNRERAHRQRVKGLEEQVSTLKEQLQHELRRRHPSLPLSN
ncbi:Rootletin [Bagarius yarrelli]|uniref:Rootletin n=1 Tax=Bagarius yarrelli TaxID=175774 RepID=A0A556VVI4_BAGYA|nr:Rootletin [Bagarius yarrelli]